jgi:cell pole-organizing protein PopZ
MSAVTSNSSERELEALRRAQRAHEPSMEEILASIRTIIADERDPAKAGLPKAGPHRPATPAPSPQIVYSKDATVVEPVAQEPPQLSENGQSPEAGQPKVVWSQPERKSSESAGDPASVGDGLSLSAETDKAVSSAFGALSAELAARSAELADGMVRDMLRPMLKAWLDENLLAVVERLVGAEIERLARGPR